jgi:hypothetical protein
MSIVDVVAGSVAIWRVTHLLAKEDGPWDLIVSLRKLAGSSTFGKMLDCFYCLSVWVAVPFAWALGTNWKERLILWPALSGAAILLERATVRTREPVAEWQEESEDA